MKDTKPKAKTEIKNVRYTFTLQEREQLGVQLAQCYGSLRNIEKEFDQVKQGYKARTAEVEASVDRISTNINNGFEMRNVECLVTYRPKDKEKDYWLPNKEGTDAAPGLPVLTEKMTPDDFQQELIAAEAPFDCREEIVLFQPTENDRGILVVGRLVDKWYSALRVKIGKLELTERLDAEQRAYKLRPDAVASAVKRFNQWAKEHLKEQAEGFREQSSMVIEAHKERAE